MLDIESLRLAGDTQADDCVASLIDFGDLERSEAVFAAILGWLRGVQTNGELRKPRLPDALDPSARVALARFLEQATQPPAFADSAQITVTERAFEDKGYLSSLIYLCASLPEVYAVPDISSVLHVTGQLESAAEQRIRSTATMVLSVLLQGGLLSPDGVGLVLTLRARLIHSLLRVLLLRGRPQDVRDFGGHVPPIDLGRPPRNLFELAYTNGWNLREARIPCNQSEMLYTLLTFGFVFLRSVKRLDVALSREQQQAYLHTWNVVGHHMGIDAGHLPRTYAQAEQQFRMLQRNALAPERALAAHSALGRALLAPLERSLRPRGLRPLARFLTRYLTSRRTARTLSLLGRTDALFYRALPLSLGLLKLSDRMVRPISGYSPAGGIYRSVSLSIIEEVLLDADHPLTLPPRQIAQVDELVSRWKLRPATA